MVREIFRRITEALSRITEIFRRITETLIAIFRGIRETRPVGRSPSLALVALSGGSATVTRVDEEGRAGGIDVAIELRNITESVTADERTAGGADAVIVDAAVLQCYTGDWVLNVWNHDNGTGDLFAGIPDPLPPGSRQVLNVSRDFPVGLAGATHVTACVTAASPVPLPAGQSPRPEQLLRVQLPARIDHATVWVDRPSQVSATPPDPAPRTHDQPVYLSLMEPIEAFLTSEVDNGGSVNEVIYLTITGQVIDPHHRNVVIDGGSIELRATNHDRAEIAQLSIATGDLLSGQIRPDAADAARRATFYYSQPFPAAAAVGTNTRVFVTVACVIDGVATTLTRSAPVRLTTPHAILSPLVTPAASPSSVYMMNNGPCDRVYTNHATSPLTRYVYDYGMHDGTGFEHRSPSPLTEENRLIWQQPVRAVADGVVVFSNNLTANFPSGGNVVIMRHDGLLNTEGVPYYSLYAHLDVGSPIAVSPDLVTAGTTIGNVGMTGTGSAHLHFGIFSYEDGRVVSVPPRFSDLESTSGNAINAVPRAGAWIRTT